MDANALGVLLFLIIAAMLMRDAAVRAVRVLELEVQHVAD